MTRCLLWGAKRYADDNFVLKTSDSIKQCVYLKTYYNVGNVTALIPFCYHSLHVFKLLRKFTKFIYWTPYCLNSNFYQNQKLQNSVSKKLKQTALWFSFYEKAEVPEVFLLGRSAQYSIWRWRVLRSHRMALDSPTGQGMCRSRRFAWTCLDDLVWYNQRQTYCRWLCTLK